jgi:hypothetical protein
MFAPRIYWRLFQSINREWWPAHLALIGLPLAWLAARTRGRMHWTHRIALPASFLAGCWTIVAWAFHHQRFAPINWIADAYAVSFAVAATGFLALAAIGSLRARVSSPRAAVALALALTALVVYPLLSMLGGRPWQQAEIFGLAPDPTAIGTLGFVLLLNRDVGAARWLRWLLWTVAVAWCLISAATLATMGSPQAAVLVAAVLLALIGSRVGKPA